MDVRPGGAWDFIMHGPDGTDFKNKSVFKEIIRHKKIVYEHVSGPKFTATVHFDAQDDQTFLSWHMLFDSKEEFIRTVKTFKADEGLKQNIIKLESYLTKGYAANELTFTRLINAPIDLVYKAWTDEKMLAKWWGPNGCTSPVCQWSPTPGGRIFIEMKSPDGNTYPMDGEVHEIIANKKIRFTCGALDESHHRLFDVIITVNFAEENGRTRLNLHLEVSNIKPGSSQYLKGITSGWSQSLERLVNLVE
jgi:uncharacterized protein YndB with AHSA1/START domain